MDVHINTISSDLLNNLLLFCNMFITLTASRDTKIRNDSYLQCLDYNEGASVKL